MFRDLDSSVLYRVGETRGGATTYTPRMAFFERRGAMGGASAAGHLYGDASGTDGNQIPPILTWDGATKVIEQPEEGESRFVAQLEAYDDDSDDDSTTTTNVSTRTTTTTTDRALWLSRRTTRTFLCRNRSRTLWRRCARAWRATFCALTRTTARRAQKISDSRRGSREKKRETRLARRRDAARAREARRADEANAKLVEFAKTLESESRTWTDFSKASFHSRSTFLLDGVWSGVDGVARVRRASRGPPCDRREDLRDVARRWAEECDRMQGFQVFAEDLGGFGGSPPRRWRS